jgi:hypothetical protein
MSGQDSRFSFFNGLGATSKHGAKFFSTHRKLNSTHLRCHFLRRIYEVVCITPRRYGSHDHLEGRRCACCFGRARCMGRNEKIFLAAAV